MSAEPIECTGPSFHCGLPSAPLRGELPGLRRFGRLRLARALASEVHVPFLHRARDGRGSDQPAHAADRDDASVLGVTDGEYLPLMALHRPSVLLGRPAAACGSWAARYDRAVESKLDLRPLREDEYPVWRDMEIEEYGRDISENGDTPLDAARRKAETDMAEILPDGLATPKHWMFVIEVDGAPAGRLWISEREIDGRRAIFIFDVHVDEAFRGRGFGRAAMLLAEREALARDIHRIELNVFGGNTVARGLYRSLGYVERSVRMAKDLA
jgi:ribosomal protein S18 acetylase RimI-like enzyme